MTTVPLRRKGWDFLGTVASEKEPDKEYEIRRDPASRTVGCACMGWAIRKTCKHVKAWDAGTLPAKVVRPVVPAERVRVVSAGESFTVVRRGIDFNL